MLPLCRKRNRLGERIKTKQVRELAIQRFEAAYGEGAYLRRKTIKPVSVKLYSQREKEFRDWAIIEKLKITKAKHIDKALEKYLDGIYRQGCGIEQCRSTIYAVAWINSLKASHLPLSSAALKGFKKLHPERGRDPLPFEALLLGASWLAAQGDPLDHQVARAGILQFDSGGRSRGVLGMKFSWIITPVIGAKSTMSQWAIQFYPSTESEVSKTNTTDDTVFIGTTMSQRTIALNVLRFLHRVGRLQSDPSKPVFSCTYADYLKRWKKAFSQVGLAHMNITPHMFRHGCASHDAINGESRAAIKTRGGWASEASVDRYMKPGRYMTMLNKMIEEQLISARASINQLEHKLCHLVTEPESSHFEPRVPAPGHAQSVWQPKVE